MINLVSLTVARRLFVLVASALLGVVVLAGVFLVSERTLVLEERESAVRQTVEIAHGVASYYQEQATSGKLSPDDAKSQALSVIKHLRYSGEEYFWINDMHPTMVRHAAKPEMRGQDLSGFKSPTGQFLFNDMVQVVKAEGAGFVSYLWPKSGSSSPVPKISYVKGFAPWGWVIGSGVYVDNVDSAVMGRAVSFTAGSLVLVALLMGIGWVISRSILNQLGGEPDYTVDVTQRIANGDLALKVDLQQNDQASLL